MNSNDVEFLTGLARKRGISIGRLINDINKGLRDPAILGGLRRELLIEGEIDEQKETKG